MEAAQYANPKHFNAYAAGGSTPPRDGRRAHHHGTPSRDRRAGGTPVRAGPTPTAPAPTMPPEAPLVARLSQYTRGSDRRQVLRSLADPRLLPRSHPLGSVWVEDIAAAEREAAGERATLNGVPFLRVRSPPPTDGSGNGTGNADGAKVAPPAPVDSYFLRTLREICGHVCDMDGVDADPMALYGGLLLRLSRSVAERDALGVLTRWTSGKGELVPLPLKRRHHHRGGDRGGGGGDACLPLAAPVDVELYVESGNVHARVTSSHELGLFKRTELEGMGLKQELTDWTALVLASRDETTRSASEAKLGRIQGEAVASGRFGGNAKPWVFVDADVVERINFGTGGSVRMLHLRMPEDKNSGYVKKW